MGPYRGGQVRLSRVCYVAMRRNLQFILQAQYIRVPYADFNALKLPKGKEHESDFILLAGTLAHSWLRFFLSLTILRHLPYR